MPPQPRPRPRPPDQPIDLDAVVRAIDSMLAGQRAKAPNCLRRVETPANGVAVRWTTRNPTYSPVLTVYAPADVRQFLLTAYRGAHYRAEEVLHVDGPALAIYP